MFNMKEMEEKYRNDSAFNAGVRCFRSMLEQHGFLPSEIREMLFFAQYMFETGRVEQIIRSKEEWEQYYEARELLKQSFSFVEPDK